PQGGGEPSESAACRDCSYANTRYFLSPAASAARVHLTVSRAMELREFVGRPAHWLEALRAELGGDVVRSERLVGGGTELADPRSRRAGGRPASKSGSPASTMVGTFGAACARSDELWASALSRPASTCGRMVEATPSIMDTRPAKRSVTAGGLPW